LIPARCLDEEAPQAFRRDVVLDALRIRSASGDLDTLVVEIGRKNLGVEQPVLFGGKFGQRNGERIGLLARRAAENPDTDRFLARARAKESRKYLFSQYLERARIAEEPGGR
jgi:hypothetical protein